MTRFTTVAACALGAALVLSACTVTIEVPISDRVDDSVVPTQQSFGPITDATPGDTVQLDPGEQRVYRVDADGMQGYQALYVALDETESGDPDVELRVYRSGGSLYASSATAAFFGPGNAGLATSDFTDAGVDMQAISEQIVCPGSCVISPSLSNARYFSVRNTGTSSRTVDVYAVLRDFADTNEPNQTTSGAADLDKGGAVGALETVDDTDVFVVRESGRYELIGAESSGIDYLADVYWNGDIDGSPDETFGGAGDTRRLEPGDLVFVYSQDGRAAPSGGSRYNLF